ncbi:MAG: hypothetical protein R3294_12795 [Arenibacter troitsensis]|nr:hypothetical protein [Arenibacter troitsensis]
MKVMIHKILALLMAFFMLVSTVSWTVEKHFCFGSLVDIAFFHEADTCGMDLGLVVVDVSSKNNPNTCCSDETILVQGQDDLSISYDDLSFGQQQFLVAFTSSYIKLFQPREQHYVPHADYPPPILVRDIHILDQVFLI